MFLCYIFYCFAIKYDGKTRLYLLEIRPKLLGMYVLSTYIFFACLWMEITCKGECCEVSLSCFDFLNLHPLVLDMKDSFKPYDFKTFSKLSYFSFSTFPSQKDKIKNRTRNWVYSANFFAFIRSKNFVLHLFTFCFSCLLFLLMWKYMTSKTPLLREFFPSPFFSFSLTAKMMTLQFSSIESNNC